MSVRAVVKDVRAGGILVAVEVTMRAKIDLVSPDLESLYQAAIAELEQELSAIKAKRSTDNAPMLGSKTSE